MHLIPLTGTRLQTSLSDIRNNVFRTTFRDLDYHSRLYIPMRPRCKDVLRQCLKVGAFKTVMSCVIGMFISLLFIYTHVERRTIRSNVKRQLNKYTTVISCVIALGLPPVDFNTYCHSILPDIFLYVISDTTYQMTLK